MINQMRGAMMKNLEKPKQSEEVAPQR